MVKTAGRLHTLSPWATRCVIGDSCKGLRHEGPEGVVYGSTNSTIALVGFKASLPKHAGGHTNLAKARAQKFLSGGADIAGLPREHCLRGRLFPASRNDRLRRGVDSAVCTVE